MRQRVTAKQENSRMCLVCGLKNPFGLKASFYELENDELLAIFRPSEEHQSYPGRLHGGIATAVLDETIGRAILMKVEDIWGVTIDFQWKDLRTGKMLVERNNYRVTGYYVPSMPFSEGFFHGSEDTVNRLARRIVEEMREDW